MRLILRVFLATLVSLALVIFIARMDDPDCLRLAGYDFFQSIDLRTAQVFSRTHFETQYNRVYYTTSPDKAYRGFFQGRDIPDTADLYDFTYDFQVTAIDDLGREISTPRTLYRDLPEHLEVGGGYAGAIVDAIWLPDSRHILLYWMPDYYRYYYGTGDQITPITHSVHQFVIVDVEGNITAQRTIAIPLPSETVGNRPELHSFTLDSISADGKFAAFQHSDGDNRYVEVWSLTDLQPVAAPVEQYVNGCYSSYESSDAYCANWSPTSSVMTMVGKQANGTWLGTPMLVIQDFETGQRHTIPLPIASDARKFLVMPWSPDGEHDVVSWFDGVNGSQLYFDRRGNTLSIVPDATLQEPDYTPLHTWTADGSGLLYYYDQWNRNGYKGRLFLGKTNRLITLPDSLVNDPWFKREAWRGSQIAIVANAVNEQAQTSDVKVGVLNIETGSFTNLYTFKNAWINRDDYLWVHWLSDTRFAVATSFAFAWGKIDGTDWHEPAEPLSIYQNAFAPDGKSVLVVKQAEGTANIYALTLDTAELNPMMSADASLVLNDIARSPSGRFSYRLLVNKAGETSLQLTDTLTKRSYIIEKAVHPMWTPDELRFVLITIDGDRQRSRVVSSATGDILSQSYSKVVVGQGGSTSSIFGHCH